MLAINMVHRVASMYCKLRDKSNFIEHSIFLLLFLSFSFKKLYYLCKHNVLKPVNPNNVYVKYILYKNSSEMLILCKKFNLFVRWKIFLT